MDKRTPLQEFNIKDSLGPMVRMGFFVDHDETEFDPEATKFNITNAWWMAEFSRLVYIEDVKFIKKTLKKIGFPKVKFFDIEGSQALVAHNDESIIVAFAGTELDEGFEDILVDLEFYPTKAEKGGYVHKGFKRGLDYIWDDILKYVRPLLENRSLWYTGHSLGAALATLATSRLPAQGTYVFGSPRVGSKGFEKNLRSPVYRIAKSRDIVTRIPTPPIYWHVGDLYFIGSKEQILKNPSWVEMLWERLGGTEWKVLWFLIQAIVFKAGLGIALKYLHDHSPYNYSVYIWNAIDTYEEPEETPILWDYPLPPYLY